MTDCKNGVYVFKSVDRNYEDNASNNRTPSSIKRAIINASNLNQVLPTSPINSQPASQRYVPPPQSSQRYQPDPLQQQQYSPNRQYQQQQFQLPVSPRGQQQPYNLNKVSNKLFMCFSSPFVIHQPELSFNFQLGQEEKNSLKYLIIIHCGDSDFNLFLNLLEYIKIQKKNKAR